MQNDFVADHKVEKNLKVEDVYDIVIRKKQM